jgi:hypothetical protein
VNEGSRCREIYANLVRTELARNSRAPAVVGSKTVALIAQIKKREIKPHLRLGSNETKD